MQSRAARANTVADVHCLTANLDFLIVKKKIYFCSFFKGKKAVGSPEDHTCSCTVPLELKKNKQTSYRDIWGFFISPDGTRPRAKTDFTLNLFV